MTCSDCKWFFPGEPELDAFCNIDNRDTHRRPGWPACSLFTAKEGMPKISPSTTMEDFARWCRMLERRLSALEEKHK